jgi:quinol monooxygenase YgiN
MAVAVIVQGGTREEYDAVAERINAEGIPEGAIIHTATETPDGVRMLDVWESREAFERFMQERIAPLAEELEIDMTGAKPEIYELFTVILNQEARV